MSQQRLKSFSVISVIILLAVSFLGLKVYQLYYQSVLEKKILNQIIARLEGESRIAEVMVIDSFIDENTAQKLTTIKFLEFDTQGRPLAPKHFTFHGDLLQFQSLVVRFDDKFIRNGDTLRGKSAFVFWKIFRLDGTNTEEYEINRFSAIPDGYKVDGPTTAFEREFWENFWKLALDPKYSHKLGVKNAQIEAPGTRFVPGIIYTLKVENDGGTRIDTSAIPEILRGEVVK